jgi:hypothetical protein
MVKLNRWQVHTWFELRTFLSSVFGLEGTNELVDGGCRPDCRSRLCDRATFSACKNMSADRKAAFKQPPRHVIDTALSQEVRRSKVCCCETTLYNRLHLHDRGTQALEEQKRVRHILVESGSAIQRISYI